MSVTLLIDADTLVYKFAYGNVKEYQWDAEHVSLHVDLKEAEVGLQAYIEELADKLNATRVVMALTDPLKNFRDKIYPQYKADRPSERPPLWSDLRAYIEESWKTYQKPTLEGDDVLGILATHPSIIKEKKVVVSIDKDMMTIPGEHYNPDKNANFYISEDEADYWHMYQTLVGDVADHYPGLPNVGPVRAVKLIGATPPHEEWTVAKAWSEIVWAYQMRGLTEDDALIQARMARILRAEDYDFKRKEPILWTPPTFH